ncbi:hypothetical protein [Streptomyces sp. NPDC058695]|uniref:hypothetical protein n=1 Tax=Streptomyces sp. NPDC058695 TaxID=3346604 RepID=UPI003668A473
MAEQTAPQPPPHSPAPVAMSLGSGCFPWTLLAVLIALVSGLLLILGRGGEPGNGHPDGGKQQAYVDEIDEARQQLFKGELVAPVRNRCILRPAAIQSRTGPRSWAVGARTEPVRRTPRPARALRSA